MANNICMQINDVKKLKQNRVQKSSNVEQFEIGILHVFSTHLLFVDTETRKETWLDYSVIANVEKSTTNANGSPIQIRCKNFERLVLFLPKERDAYNLYVSLCEVIKISSIDRLPCFNYQGANENFSFTRSETWTFDIRDEYNRLDLPDIQWKVTDINKNYELCDTYPQYLAVPVGILQSMLQGSAKFRSKGRLPVMTYRHHNGASICRCSQPLTGFNARNSDDEALITAIMRTTKSESLCIVDTRPMINAVANMAAGKGFEGGNNYLNVKHHFVGIENIHVMRDSLQKLLDACHPAQPHHQSVSLYQNNLCMSGWLKHVKSVLEATNFVADAILTGTSVIIHCSDGWDRTAQTCALSSLILDPFYRTMDGFKTLVEKEWLAFGHKFNDRCGHLSTGPPKDISPIFDQFLDCVWQIWQQFPREFEFNEKFLLKLHFHLYSCQYGTFIGNCDRERNDLNLREKTFSIWSYFQYHRNQFLNPFYVLSDPKNRPQVLKLSAAPQNIRLWKNLYCRFNVDLHPRENLNHTLFTRFYCVKSLENHLKFLEMRISNLQGTSINSSPSGDPLSNFGFKELIDRLDSEGENGLKAREICDRLLLPESLSVMDIKENSETNDKHVELEKIAREIDSIAIDWCPMKSASQCRTCRSTFNIYDWRLNCFTCGQCFCHGCASKCLSLPGHGEKHGDYFDRVTVCINCYKSFQ